MRSNGARSGIAQRLAAGVAGGIAGSLAMNLVARAAGAATGGREAASAAPGPDRYGRGAQPPQAAGRADEDATVRLASALYRVATDQPPTRRTARALGTAAHYAFGAAVGACYALLAPRIPAITRANGLAYGALVWILADEIAMPALRLSRGPRQLGLRLLALGLAEHCAYGAALDAVRRGLDRHPNDHDAFPVGDWAQFPGAPPVIRHGAG
jgi:putative membrane protein